MMRFVAPRLGSIAGLLLVLASCSGGPDAPTLELQVIDSVRGSIAARTTAQPARPPVTRALLDTLDGAFLEVTREERNQTAFLSPSVRTRDSQPGAITVWRTETDETLTVRGGMLIATRGLGGDILSTDMRVGAGGLGPAPAGKRVIDVRNADNRKVAMVLDCRLADLGSETIEIIGARHATRHLQEHCTGAGGRVVNDYWIDSGSGLIWQSRQWAGPHIGYLRLRQVTR